ncbi:conserved uncharacterized protein [Desulfococcus multivorans]|nr:conserved uncharacterized protein [Desulfococcus multivorans]
MGGISAPVVAGAPLQSSAFSLLPPLSAKFNGYKETSDTVMAFNQITLNPSGIVRLLGAMAFFLVLASIVGQLSLYLTGPDHIDTLIQLFYIDAERNFPTIFSTLLLLFASLLLLAITLVERRRAGSAVSDWALLSLGFLCMAADEGWQFHERLMKPMYRLLGVENLGIFYFPWVIPGIALVLVLGLYFSKFLLHLPAKTRRNFLLAGTLYIGGAVGVELITGRYADVNGMYNLTYSMLATVEESLEMAGAIVFIRALLAYIVDNYREVRLRFGAFGPGNR